MKKNFMRPLQLRHQDVMQKADQLYEAVNNLVYEGRASYGKNIKNVDRIIKFFRGKLFPHMNFDERVIFPFIESHIPKYGPLIQLLIAEHNELKDNFKILENLYKKIKSEKNDTKRQETIDKLRDKGIYLFCVIRNHLQGENESIYKAAQEQLNEREKRELLSKVSACSCARNYLNRRGENRIG